MDVYIHTYLNENKNKSDYKFNNKQKQPLKKTSKNMEKLGKSPMRSRGTSEISMLHSDIMSMAKFLKNVRGKVKMEINRKNKHQKTNEDKNQSKNNNETSSVLDKSSPGIFQVSDPTQAHIPATSITPVQSLPLSHSPVPAQSPVSIQLANLASIQATVSPSTPHHHVPLYTSPSAPNSNLSLTPLMAVQKPNFPIGSSNGLTEGQNLYYFNFPFTSNHTKVEPGSEKKTETFPTTSQEVPKEFPGSVNNRPETSTDSYLKTMNFSDLADQNNSVNEEKVTEGDFHYNSNNGLKNFLNKSSDSSSSENETDSSDILMELQQSECSLLFKDEMFKVMLLNLHPQVSYDEVSSLLQDIGFSDVEDIILVNQVHQSISVVTFENKTSMERALSYNEKLTHRGRIITIRLNNTNSAARTNTENCQKIKNKGKRSLSAEGSKASKRGKHS